MIYAEGYPAVPSTNTPSPGSDPYFNGGYNTVQRGSVNGGSISGMQIESNMTGVRDTAANRTAYAQALSRVLEKYFALHYATSLRGCVPSIWDSASGNWSSGSNWYDGAVPVSSNHLAFVGSGGKVTNNLSALTTGNGVVGSISFSNTAAGDYTLSGNAFTLLAGVTSTTSFTNAVNNNITLIGPQTFTANSGPLSFGGGITNGGNQLTLAGSAGITVNGVISGSGGLVKSGAGACTLTAANTYAGGTLITSSNLLVNNTAGIGTGSGTVTVTNTGVLGGYGAVGNTVVEKGGTLSPGASVSNLTVSALTCKSGGNYRWEISAAATDRFTVKIDSLGTAPTGWSNSAAYDWEILRAGMAVGFSTNSFVVDASDFAASVNGTFGLSLVGGALHLAYTPSVISDSGERLDEVVEKRRLAQALNAKEFAVVAGVSYSAAREWFRVPGARWRRVRFP